MSFEIQSIKLFAMFRWFLDGTFECSQQRSAVLTGRKQRRSYSTPEQKPGERDQAPQPGRLGTSKCSGALRCAALLHCF